MDTFVPRSFVTALAILAVGASACGKSGSKTPDVKKSLEDGFAIGLLLPESKTTRYETFDKPLIEKYVHASCPKCTVLYQNADQDAAKQQTQADALLNQGIQVLIIDAVDAAAAASIVEKAKQQKVPVIAYDRFASGPIDSFVTFDSERIGQEQGKALLEALSQGGDPKRGAIVMINGAITDPSSADYKRGAHSVLDGKVQIGFEVDTPDWSPDKAQQEMEQAMTKLGADKIIGVYVANDGMASGVIAALKGHGVTPIPPVTGQDAELAAIQRLISGDQYMTIYTPYSRQAEAAAKMALAAAQGKPVQGDDVRENATHHRVPTVQLPVVAVTKANVKDTVLADGIYKTAEICTSEYAPACKQAGLL
jgi:D-xylose transport system substrate-binding protein